MVDLTTLLNKVSLTELSDEELLEVTLEGRRRFQEAPKKKADEKRLTAVQKSLADMTPEELRILQEQLKKQGADANTAE